MVMAPPSTASAGAWRLGGLAERCSVDPSFACHGWFARRVVGRTQWVVLSAPDEHPWCGTSHAGPGRGVDGADGAIQPLVTLLCEPFTQRAMRDAGPSLENPVRVVPTITRCRTRPTRRQTRHAHRTLATATCPYGCRTAARSSRSGLGRWLGREDAHTVQHVRRRARISRIESIVY